MEMKRIRKELRVNQKEIARKLNISQGAYSKKECNPDSFKPSELMIVAKEFGLSMDDLYEKLEF